MKKRFLALLTMLLVAALMTTAVCATTTLVRATTGEGVDYGALTEAQTFDVYIVVSPMTVASGSNYIYRVSEDTTTGAPTATKNKLTDEKFTLAWDNKSLEVSAVEYYQWNDTDKLAKDWVVGDGYKLAYLAKLGTNPNNTNAIQEPVSVTGVGTGASNTGTLVIDFGDTKTGGFMIREETSAPNAAVAKVTFKVVAGAEGGEETITLDNTYKVSGTSYSATQTSVSVTVVAGCDHAGKVALTPEELAAKGLENSTPTCIATGTTWYHCSACGKDVAETLNVIPHDFSVEKYVEGHVPTCYVGGQKAMYCSTEGCTAYDAATVEDVPVLGHSCTEQVYLAPNCTDEGYDYYWCTRCHGIAAELNASSVVSGAYYIDGKLYSNPAGTVELTEVPAAVVIAALGHDWVYDRTEGDTQYYYCSRKDECGATEYAVTSADTVRYAADVAKGTKDGSSAENATTYAEAFEDLGKLPAGVDATLYIVETINIPSLQVSGNNTVVKSFEEYRHDAHITVTTAPGVSKAALYFDFSLASQYYLSGPTTFDNIIISSNAKGGTGGSSESISIFGRGFRFEATENLTMESTLTGTDAKITYSKEKGTFGYSKDVSYDFAACKIYLIGGFYPNGLYEGANGKTFTTDLVINGGEFYVVAGGSRTNDGLPISGSEINISVGGNAVIGQLAPISIYNSSINLGDTVANIHYYGGTIIVGYRAEMQPRPDDCYTVNHFFHNGSGKMVIGDFQMGQTHKKNVNCYYSVSDNARPSAEDYGLAFIAKGDTNASSYGETNENMTFPEYCSIYLDGHDLVDGECTFCQTTVCAEHVRETVIASEPTCVADGVWVVRCSVCMEKLGEERFPASSEYHEAEWRVNGNTYEYYCHICKKVIATRANTATEFYVSDNGFSDGGFTADYPLNDFEKAFDMAVAAGKDVTIYIVGSVTIPSNCTASNSHYVFAEPTHSKTITIAGYKNVGVFKFSAAGSGRQRVIYALNGDTTFENVEFSSWDYEMASGKTDYFTYFAAQHNHLTFGENVTTDFMRNTQQNRITSSYIVLGGCYHNLYTKTTATHATTCRGGENHVTFCSGSFYRFTGGSVGGNCSDSDIIIEILGDVSFRDYFVFGGFEFTSGDALFVLDGNLSVGNYFSLAGANKNPKYTEDSVAKFDLARLDAADVGDVTLKILNGSITTQNFQATTSSVIARPIGASLYGVVDNREDTTQEFDLTRQVESLTIIYNPANGSAKETALRFDALESSKVITYKKLNSDAVCPNTANGEHVQGAEVERVESICSAQGHVIYKCTVCGNNYSVALDEVPHNFGEGVTASAATCTNPEIEKKVCVDCGYIEYYIGDEPATGEHVYDENNICTGCMQNKQTLCEHENWSEPVEIKTGCGVGTMIVCDECGKEVIEVTGADHNFGKYTVTVQPTETEPGVKTRTCRSCGKVETAVIYADGGAINSTAIATDANGNLADLDVATSKLTSAEKEVLNALLQDTSYGSEVKVSYKVDGDNVTDITYSIPLPAEYADLKNVKVVVKDENGTLHAVEFTVEKGFIVFKF